MDLCAPIDFLKDGGMKRDSWIFSSITLALLGATFVALALEQGWISWWQRPLRITLVAKSAKSLSPGMEVKLSGLTVGRLKTLSIAGDARIIGKLDVDPGYASFIGPSSVLRVDQEGLIGDSFISITPDLAKVKPKKVNRASDSTLELPLEPALDTRELLIGLAQTRMRLDATIANAGKVYASDVPITLSSMRQGAGSFSDLAKALQKETEDTAPVVRETLQSGQSGVNQLGAAGVSVIVTSEELRDLIQTPKAMFDR